MLKVYSQIERFFERPFVHIIQIHLPRCTRPPFCTLTLFRLQILKRSLHSASPFFDPPQGFASVRSFLSKVP